jgi:ribonuclease P protein component
MGWAGEDKAKRAGRVGFVVPERAIKLATRRNRVRRLLKEAVRLWWHGIQPGFDVILSVSESPRHDHAGYVEGVLLQLLIEADLLKPEARSEAERRLSEMPPEFHEKGRAGCTR